LIFQTRQQSAIFSLLAVKRGSGAELLGTLLFSHLSAQQVQLAHKANRAMLLGQLARQEPQAKTVSFL
jgi:hypothetical protein